MEKPMYETTVKTGLSSDLTPDGYLKPYWKRIKVLPKFGPDEAFKSYEDYQEWIATIKDDCPY